MTKVYSSEFILSLKYKVNRELPYKTLNILNLNRKIKATLNEKDLKIFNRKMDNFNEPELKKKINSLLNKLTKDNFDSIFQKLIQILKNRKVLIKYTINNLINKAILQNIFIDIYTIIYKKLYTVKTQKIFDNTFNELLEILKNKNENKNQDYDTFCKYIKDKTRFVNLFVLLASLYNNNIVSKDIIISNIKYLEDTILKSNKTENEKYCESYSNFIKKLNNKEYIDLLKIKEMKSSGLITIKSKFNLMDLEDLYKKL